MLQQVKLQFIAEGSRDCPLLLFSHAEPRAVRSVAGALGGVSCAPVSLDQVEGFKPIDGFRLAAVLGKKGRGARSVGPNAFL